MGPAAVCSGLAKILAAPLRDWRAEAWKAGFLGFACSAGPVAGSGREVWARASLPACPAACPAAGRGRPWAGAADSGSAAAPVPTCPPAANLQEWLQETADIKKREGGQGGVRVCAGVGDHLTASCVLAPVHPYSPVRETPALPGSQSRVSGRSRLSPHLSRAVRGDKENL